MKEKQSLWERLDLPGESFPGEVLVEIAGDNRVLIEHHRGVREYSPYRIGVKVGFGLVEICGSGLELRSMARQQLVISGCIDCVALKRRERR